MTIPLAVNFGVSQRAPRQTLPGILGIEAGKSADVAFAQLRPQFRGGLPPSALLFGADMEIELQDGGAVLRQQPVPNRSVAHKRRRAWATRCSLATFHH
jgi:hypothetical protein